MPSAEMTATIEMMRAQPLDAGLPLEDLRAAIDAMGDMMPADPGVVVNEVSANGVPGVWVEAPGVDQTRAVLYVHGGGYVIGSTKGVYPQFCGRLSARSGARVLSIDYRLAPEHPYPAAVEDAVTAYRYLLDQGFAHKKLAISGDSAGGGLTLATLIALRDQGLPMPGCAVPLSAWTDLAITGGTISSKAGEDPLVQEASIKGMADAYLAGKDPKSPTASPLYADLKGLPPLLMEVGTAETLLDDSLRFADRARAAGVDVRCVPCEGAIHVYQAYAPHTPEAIASVSRIGAFIAAHTE